MSVSQTAHVNPGELFVGVRFRPDCQITLQKQDYSSLKDTKAYRDAMHSAFIDDFEADMQSMTAPHEVEKRLQSVVQSLVTHKLVLRDAVVDEFLARAKADGSRTKIVELAEELPISARQFRRRFIQYTGFTPKQFLRLHRQQQAITDLKRNRTSITDIAAQHGYTDHAHFLMSFGRT